VSPLTNGTVRAPDRLVAAARTMIVERGASAGSARTIAAEAGASASAINYNFGDLERLFGVVFEGELAELPMWAGAMTLELAELPSSPRGASAALAHVIRRWTGDRDRALLYAEARLRPGTEASLGPRFVDVWRDFWEATAHRLQLPPGSGALLHVLFEAESLFHLSRWRPALEDAALVDVCDCLIRRWVYPAPASPAGCEALEAAVATSAPPVTALAGEASRVASVALHVIGERGLAGLTHRAVAAAAGVTAGAVAHYFRTSEALLTNALKAQVDQLLLELQSPNEPADSPDEFVSGLASFAARPALPAQLAARRTLFLATVRDPSLAGAGAVIRYAQGATVRNVLAPLVAERSDALAIAGVVSRLSSSIWHVCAGRSENDRLGLARGIAEGLTRLGEAALPQ
jgi:AcrR family transcriptional regulator